MHVYTESAKGSQKLFVYVKYCTFLQGKRTDNEKKLKTMHLFLFEFLVLTQLQKPSIKGTETKMKFSFRKTTGGKKYSRFDYTWNLLHGEIQK